MTKERIAVSGTLVLFLLLALYARQADHFGWDLMIARYVQSIQVLAFDTLMRGVSFLGTGWTAVGMVVSIGLLLIVFGKHLEGALCMGGVGLGSLVNRLVKIAVGRVRPGEDLIEVLIEYAHESFPSGHVVLFVNLFGFLGFLSCVYVKSLVLRILSIVLCAGLIVLVGPSRVYLGAHWPSDVLGGYLLGALWLTLMIRFYQRRKLNDSDSY